MLTQNFHFHRKNVTQSASEWCYCQCTLSCAYALGPYFLLVLYNSHASINFVYVIKIIIVLTDNFFMPTCKMESNFNVLFVICSIQCVFLQRKVTCSTCSHIYIIKSWNNYILREIIQTSLYNIVQNIQFFCLTFYMDVFTTFCSFVDITQPKCHLYLLYMSTVFLLFLLLS